MRYDSLYQCEWEKHELTHSLEVSIIYYYYGIDHPTNISIAKTNTPRFLIFFLPPQPYQFVYFSIFIVSIYFSFEWNEKVKSVTSSWCRIKKKRWINIAQCLFIASILFIRIDIAQCFVICYHLRLVFSSVYDSVEECLRNQLQYKHIDVKNVKKKKLVPNVCVDTEREKI